jgi:rhodanese-related sulfurtransferase
MRKEIWPWGVLLACALLLAACGSPAPEGNARTVKGFAKNTDGYADISVDQLAELMDEKDFVLVIPFNEIGDHLDELPAKDAPIVLYCRSGSMSTTAAEVLAGEGYMNVMEVDGGFNAWKAKGYELLDKR